VEADRRQAGPLQQVSALEVHVLPLERQQLALARVGAEGKHVEGFEPVIARLRAKDSTFAVLSADAD
jgi:hypothetical protein